MTFLERITYPQKLVPFRGQDASTDSGGTFTFTVPWPKKRPRMQLHLIGCLGDATQPKIENKQLAIDQTEQIIIPRAESSGYFGLFPLQNNHLGGDLCWSRYNLPRTCGFSMKLQFYDITKQHLFGAHGTSS